MNIASSVVPDQWHTHPFIARLRRHIELSPKDLESLWRLCDAELTVKKRRDLVVDGYEYRKLCFVQDGFAARYKLLRNGKRQIVKFILPGDMIGFPGSFVEKANYSVIALTDLKLQACPINSYVQLCYQRPQFGLALSWLAVEEMIACKEQIVNLGRRGPAERFAYLLLDLHCRLTTVGMASETQFDLPLSQEVMSDALGLSVPHLNRTIAKFRADGMLGINGGRVEIIDRKALELASGFQPLAMTRIPPANGFTLN